MRNIDYLAILICNSLIFLVLTADLFDSSNPILVMVQAQNIGFYPIFFDALTFGYVLFLIYLFFRPYFYDKMIASHFNTRFYKIIISINLIFLILLGFFVPNFNPIALFFVSNQSIPLFSWLVAISLILNVLALIFTIKLKKLPFSGYPLTANFYIIFAFFLYALPIRNIYLPNFSYFFLLFIMINFQTLIFDRAKVIMTKEEFRDFISDNTIIPMRILILGGVFTSEDEYHEAMQVGAKTKNQLYLTRDYGADTYQLALQIRDANFPSYDVYKEAQDLGMSNYAEWQRYNEKQMILDLKDKIRTKKGIKLHEQELNLQKLLTKTNKIAISQLIEYMQIQEKANKLLVWLAEQPHDSPVKLEGEYLILNSNITPKQVSEIIRSLMTYLDAKNTITQADVDKVTHFFSILNSNIKITMKRLEEELDLPEEKIDYIILFLLSKNPSFVNYKVDEGVFVRKDYDLRVDTSDFRDYLTFV